MEVRDKWIEKKINKKSVICCGFLCHLPFCRKKAFDRDERKLNIYFFMCYFG